jgi:hypothetical protein
MLLVPPNPPRLLLKPPLLIQGAAEVGVSAADIMRKRSHPDATTPVGEHHEGSFGVYMRQKIARLQVSFYRS